MIPATAFLFCWCAFVVANAFIPSATKTTKFQPATNIERSRKQLFSRDWKRVLNTHLYDGNNVENDASTRNDPLVLSTGYSSKGNLIEAIQDAVDGALKGLPKPTSKENDCIDLAIISVSSLYDGRFQPSDIVPAVLKLGSVYGKGIQHLVGSYTGGIISSTINDNFGDEEKQQQQRPCKPIENEGVPSVSITLCKTPDVEIETFHVLGDDVPDNFGQLSKENWADSVGLRRFGTADDGTEKDDPVFMLIPSPAFQNDLDDFLSGLSYTYPTGKAFGGIASTVSSLSRPRLFRYDIADQQCLQTLGDGCVGVAMRGDIQVKTMIAQGAKPVGGIYKILKGIESTIHSIALDEIATAEEAEESSSDDDDDGSSNSNFDPKALVPKPILAEANFVMKRLSDDDQIFMRKALLVGLERGGSTGRTPNELLRLAEGEGHRFTVHQVASAGMKDGSVTLPLGSVDIQPGTRLRFYVREGDFAKKEIEALWMGYKKSLLTESLSDSGDDEDDSSEKQNFEPSGCLLLSTLDRGEKLFGRGSNNKGGFESSLVSDFLPTVPSISGYYCNGVIGSLDFDSPSTSAPSSSSDNMLHGSAAQYILIGSKSRRPIFSPAKERKDEADAKRKQEEEDEAEREIEAEDAKRQQRASSSSIESEEKAPRSEDGELILKRREIHAGRSISVSTVEWSVADKSGKPSSKLEGFMWDKETEVDRFRERISLQLLVSQSKAAAKDPKNPKPRDWITPVKQSISDGKFVIIPECKRMEPAYGSLHKRYDVEKLARDFTIAGAPALSVNCDAILYGGKLEDISKARAASSKAALESSIADGSDGVVVPPILASDLILYPYQLYKLRMAGADAITLVVGALESKDLLYLSKIAATQQLQSIASVTSEVQLRQVAKLSPGSISALVVSNRELEDFTFDMTGQQALDLLRSDAMDEFRAKHDIPILVEGRVAMIKRGDSDETTKYVEELKKAGANGAIVGGGLAAVANEEEGEAKKVLDKLQVL